MIDYATPQDRLNPPQRCGCPLCVSGENDLAREQFRSAPRPYTPAVKTDVRVTMYRWCVENGYPVPAWLPKPRRRRKASMVRGSDLPALVRRQAG